jgi:hypothetical protein
MRIIQTALSRKARRRERHQKGAAAANAAADVRVEWAWTLFCMK